LGLAEIDQLVPFQRSTNVEWPEYPTAKQLVALGHATADRKPSGGPAGLGLVATDQTGAALAGGAMATSVPAIRQSDAASPRNGTRRARPECDGSVVLLAVVLPAVVLPALLYTAALRPSPRHRVRNVRVSPTERQSAVGNRRSR
jgi:hypothetical protein